MGLMEAQVKPPALQAYSLEQLLRRVAGQDNEAFEQLYGATSRRIFAICFKILRDRQAAEDATQEAYLRIWRHAGSFDECRGAPLAWMGVIARNVALDLVRQSRPTELIDDADLATPAVQPPDARLGQCLRRLSPEQSHAITLMYVYGLTHSELAEQLKSPLGTVKSWTTRGLKALRACMDR